MKAERDNESSDPAASEKEPASVPAAKHEAPLADAAGEARDAAPAVSALDRVRALVASNRETRLKSKSKAKGGEASAAARPAASSDVLDRVRALIEREREARLREEAEPAPEVPATPASRGRRGGAAGRAIGGPCPQLPPSKYWFKKGEDLVARRKELGLNQTEFWSRVRVTHASGGLYERGRKMPEAVKMLLQIAYGSDAQSAEAVEVLRLPAEMRSSAAAAEPARKRTRQQWGMLP